jgi:hypothetical protein
MQNAPTETTVNPASSKTEYENAMHLSQHVAQAKSIAEMVLDAFQSSRESDQIRELRAAIRAANDEHDDDKAYELMGQLKHLKDIEAANSAALEDLSARYSIQTILASFKEDAGFQELIYGLALKVLNHTHMAIKEPAGGKSKAPRPKKENEVFTLSKGEDSITVTIKSARAKPLADRSAFEFLGFSFIGEDEQAELQTPTFTDNTGAEHPATLKNIVAAIQQQTAFEGYSAIQQ